MVTNLPPSMPHDVGALWLSTQTDRVDFWYEVDLHKRELCNLSRVSLRMCHCNTVVICILFFFLPLRGDVAICAEAFDWPNAQHCILLHLENV